MLLDKLFGSLKKWGCARRVLPLQIVNKLKDRCLFLWRKSIHRVNEVFAGHPEVSIPRSGRSLFASITGDIAIARITSPC